MNIIYHHRIASKDGQFVHIDEIVTALRKQNHSVRLIGPLMTENSDFGHDGGIVNKLKANLPKFIYELMELGYSLIAAYKLIKEIKKERPDVIYERYNLYQPAGVLVAKWFKIPLILEVNAPLKEERERFSGGLALPRLAKWVEDYTWRNASKVLPVTDVLASHCLRAGVKKGNIDVIHNGVKQSVWESTKNKDIDIGDNVLTVGFVGFMHLTCGVEKALSVVAKETNRRVHMICVGDGNVIPELKAKAASLGAEDRITFTGLVGRDDVLSYVDKFDIALQPAVTDYASPLKMFEYMAYKCLIVAPNKSNIREILSNETAILFDGIESSGFTNALRDAIKNYPEHESKRERVHASLMEKKFIWDVNAQRIVDHATDLKKV
jgi:glycosyltransferase involved in cell wall biosynthesis